MRAIEAVIFDYGGVLSTTPFVGLAEFEARMGYPDKALSRLLFGRGASPQGPTEFFGSGGPGEAAEVPDHDWHLLETGLLTLDEFHDRLVARSESVLGKRLDLGVYSQFLKELGVGVHWMMVHRVRELRAEGYRTAILTNNIKEWGPFWKGSIPLDLFDLVVDSCEVGLRKPDPAIFQLTCERLGVAPEAAVFLDDTRIHVEAARTVGLHAVLVRDPLEAIAELDAILESAAA
jgi:putative hydrolase of the HAD superfamily